MSKLIRVSNSKYRAVISDVLPFERPVFFSNRFFARFLKYYGVKTERDTLVATLHMEDEGIEEFLKIIGGNRGARRPCFQYSITKDGHEQGRCLSVIHPFHQVKMVEFYDRYKMLLIDFCQRSNFSIRFPYKVADCQKKQKDNHKLFSDNAYTIDTSESLKHFFAYKHYRNINYFYDDYRFLRAEKHFKEMTKLDLRHCFESISPEILSLAVFDHKMQDCKGSIADEFYQLQMDFENSKGGIIIGPEFSRIYAEMILQRIDCEVEKKLEKENVFRNKDYIFYRYVDDGFLYFDSTSVKELFFYVYVSELSRYGLSINAKKIINFEERPFVENISIAKGMLSQLVDDRFQNRLETFKGFVHAQDNYIDTPTQIDFKSFVCEVRNILGICGDLKYKDVTSFLLGVIQKHLVSLMSGFNLLYGRYCQAAERRFINARGLEIKGRYEKEFIEFSMNIVEILFYFLGCDMRMGTSVKVVSIISKLQLFVRGVYDIDEYTRSQKFPTHDVDLLDGKISDEIATLLMNSTPTQSNVMEVLNVLEVEKVMLQRNKIMPKVLTDFVGKAKTISEILNFFTVFELIHFIKDSDGYAELEHDLYEWIDCQIFSLKDGGNSPAESVLTFMETMCCPWVDDSKKREYAQLLSGSASERVYDFAKKQKHLFIRWHGYNLEEAILHLNSTEVY